MKLWTEKLKEWIQVFGTDSVLPVLFPTTPYTTGFSDKGFLRMVGSLLNITHTALMEWSDSPLVSGLYRGGVLGGQVWVS